ncbi:MAG: elongation factor Tu [Myxococcota bacterium]
MNKLHMNVGTIGHVDHGKTTLPAAILAVQARQGLAAAKSYGDIAKGGTVRDATKTVTIAASHVEYESERRHYAHIDCPGHADYIKNMIAGASQMDGAILLVDGSQGGQRQTQEHVLLARQVGVDNIVVFINKVDVADEELLELVELEVTEHLAEHGYVDVAVVRGSALSALRDPNIHGGSIEELIAAMDATFVAPERDLDGPFMMPVEGVHTIVGRGTVATGRVERGRLGLGDPVEVVGLHRDGDKPRSVVVTGIQMFHKDQMEARAGENCGLLLRGVGRDEIVRGQALVAPGSVTSHRFAMAEIFVLRKEEGGRHTPISAGYRPQFYFGTTDVTGTIVPDSDTAGPILPGDHAQVRIELHKPVGIEPGMRFAMREGGRTVGAGVILGVE